MYLRNAGKAPLVPASRRWPPGAGAAAGPAVVALALALTPALAACAGQQANVTLPAKGGTAAPSQAVLTGPARTPAQVVTAAYQGYWQAYAAAMTASNPGRARTILARYSTPGGITALVSSLRRVWRAHEVAYGGAVTHVLSVRITGRRASVHDCLDLSHFGVQHKATGQVVSNSFGLPDLNYYVTLELSGGRWRVSNMTPVEVPCTP